MDKAYKFAAQICPDGKLEVQVPVPPGTPVEVLALTRDTDEFHDLLQASEISTGFWDNPWTMRAGIIPIQGDIVLIPVPFSDLSSQRRRPVIVVSVAALVPTLRVGTHGRTLCVPSAHRLGRNAERPRRRPRAERGNEEPGQPVRRG